jgi:hypothetical protein
MLVASCHRFPILLGRFHEKYRIDSRRAFWRKASHGALMPKKVEQGSPGNAPSPRDGKGAQLLIKLASASVATGIVAIAITGIKTVGTEANAPLTYGFALASVCILGIALCLAIWKLR